MSGYRSAIYADSCVFIAWLSNEKRKLGEMEGVHGLVSAVDKNEVVLVTSTITETELIKLTDEQMEMFKQFTRRRNVQVKAPDIRIGALANEIRSYYQKLKDEGATALPTLTTPDAVHLATAIYWGCERLFTFDENDESGGSRPRRALIPLSGLVAGKYQIEICKPIVAEPGFAFQWDTKKDDKKPDDKG